MTSTISSTLLNTHEKVSLSCVGVHETKTLSVDRLRELLNYDPETGRFVWRVLRGAARVGMEAGRVVRDSKISYLIVRIDCCDYKAHRLAWLYMTGKWPLDQIDHKDGKGTNNRFSNLRAATASENMHNSRLRCDNTSGYKGVYYNKARGRWMGRIKVSGKIHYLGYFDTVEEARSAYQAAAEKHFGEFARSESRCPA